MLAGYGVVVLLALMSRAPALERGIGPGAVPARPRPDCLSASGLLRQVRNLADRDVYLCGPPRMADAVRTAVLRAGLPAERLHEERFAF
jgi:hypothetical protein